MMGPEQVIYGMRVRPLLQRPTALLDVPAGAMAEWLEVAHWDVLYKINVYLKEAR